LDGCDILRGDTTRDPAIGDIYLSVRDGTWILTAAGWMRQLCHFRCRWLRLRPDPLDCGVCHPNGWRIGLACSGL